MTYGSPRTQPASVARTDGRRRQGLINIWHITAKTPNVHDMTLPRKRRAAAMRDASRGSTTGHRIRQTGSTNQMHTFPLSKDEQ